MTMENQTDTTTATIDFENETISIDGTEQRIPETFNDSVMFLAEQEERGHIDIEFAEADE